MQWQYYHYWQEKILNFLKKDEEVSNKIFKIEKLLKT